MKAQALTKQMWQKMSDNEKENALLTVFEDPAVDWERMG